LAIFAAIRRASSFVGNKVKGTGVFQRRRTGETTMRILLFVFVVLATGVGIEKPAEAQSGGWCAYFDESAGGGDRQCGFVTLQQCLAEVRGVGGNCSPSPYYEAPNYYRYPPPGYPY
jgi:hypothetical protein